MTIVLKSLLAKDNSVLNFLNLVEQHLLRYNVLARSGFTVNLLNLPDINSSSKQISRFLSNIPDNWSWGQTKHKWRCSSLELYPPLRQVFSKRSHKTFKLFKRPQFQAGAERCRNKSTNNSLIYDPKDNSLRNFDLKCTGIFLKSFLC